MDKRRRRETIAKRFAFQEKAISMIQHSTIENLGDIRCIQLSPNPSLKEADLPEYYSIIPATTNKKLPLKFQT